MMINFFSTKWFYKCLFSRSRWISKTNLNYSYDENNKVVDNNAIDELNISIQKAFDILSQKIKIEFITSSIYKTKSKPKIIGVIR